MLGKHTSLSFFFASLFALNVNAQDNQDTSNVESKFPSIEVGAGVLTFTGDIGKGVDVSNYSHIRIGYHINIEKRFNAAFGASLNGLYGKVASSERSVKPDRNLNFESPIIQLGLSGVYHFDNNLILKRTSAIGPYARLGFSFIKFDPHGDLIAEDGSTYHYWTDGSIRDLAEADSNLFTSNIIKRDYDYETQLKDSATNYSRSTFTIPITIGSRFQLNDNFDGVVSATYNFAFTDHLDSYKEGAGNDGFFYFSCGIRYNFPLKIVDAPEYRNVDFAKLEKIDTDGDGVNDEKDMCLNTPKGVKVDKEGCPLDDDGDGVPNYIDKEGNTKKGAIVDASGVTITQEMASQKLNDYESSAMGRTTLDFEFVDADTDSDGYISDEEMRKAMDDFFNGKLEYSIEKFQRLVLFYSRQ